jgi:GSCFA family
MKFRSEMNLTPIKFPWSHNDAFLLLGSCFTEHIGAKLERSGFDTHLGANGIVFHPLAMARAFRRMLREEYYTVQELIFDQDKFHSFDHHGKYSDVDAHSAVESMNASLKQARDFFLEAQTVIVTFGTAWGYLHTESGVVAANCHKVNPKQFEKLLTDKVEIVTEWQSIINEVAATNKKVRWVFTVSPVRHLKDGLVENNRSKAQLLLACADLEAQNSNAIYFPSYELVQDDLRDYRFYKEDFMHPNDVAVEYVWEKFSDWAFSAETLKVMAEIERRRKRIEHRSSNPEEDQALRKQILAEIDKIKQTARNV